MKVLRSRIIRGIMLAIFLVGLLFPCLYSAQIAHASTWWDTDWDYRNVLSFKASAITDNLTNFPVKVTLSASNFDFSKAKSDGADVRFVDKDDTTSLPYEFEWWDNANETAAAWVKIPQIDAGTDNTDYFYIYYGNAGASSDADSGATWADTGAVAVWHFNEMTGTNAEDVTGNSHNGTLSGTPTWTNYTLNFDGSDDVVQMTLFYIFSSSYTMLAWVNPVNTGADARYAVFGQYNALINRSSGKLQHHNGSDYVSSTDAVNWSQWNQAVWSCNLTDSQVYFSLNGLSSGNGTASFNPSFKFIGSYNSPPTIFRLKGAIDELRIYSRVVTAEEVKGDNLNRLDTLLYYGAEEEDRPPTVTTLPATGIAWVNDESSGTFSGNLTSLGGAPSVYRWFEYGLTTSYGSSTANMTDNATGVKTASIPNGLTSGVTYHYRFVAQNADGTTNGADETFLFTPMAAHYIGFTIVLAIVPTLLFLTLLFASGSMFFSGFRLLSQGQAYLTNVIYGALMLILAVILFATVILPAFQHLLTM